MERLQEACPQMRVYEKLEHVENAETLGTFGRVPNPSFEEMNSAVAKWVDEHPASDGKKGIMNFGIAATQS